MVLIKTKFGRTKAQGVTKDGWTNKNITDAQRLKVILALRIQRQH